MLLKKQIIVLLSFLVLFTNTGMAFTVHYCDDEVASVSINNSSFHEFDKECCGKVNPLSNCCHNKIIKSNDKVDQIVAKTITHQFDALLFVEKQSKIILYTGKNFKKSSGEFYKFNSHAPPLYKLYSQYCFYA